MNSDADRTLTEVCDDLNLIIAEQTEDPRERKLLVAAAAKISKALLISRTKIAVAVIAIFFASCVGRVRPILCRPSLEAAKRYECERWGWCGPDRGAFTVAGDPRVVFTADMKDPWRLWKQPDPTPREVGCP